MSVSTLFWGRKLFTCKLCWLFGSLNERFCANFAPTNPNVRFFNVFLRGWNLHLKSCCENAKFLRAAYIAAAYKIHENSDDISEFPSKIMDFYRESIFIVNLWDRNSDWPKLWIVDQALIQERIKVDKSKCWDQKTHVEFGIYERIALHFRQSAN